MNSHKSENFNIVFSSEGGPSKRKYVLRTGPGRKTKDKFVKIEEGEKIASSDDDQGEKALKTMMLNRCVNSMKIVS